MGAYTFNDVRSQLLAEMGFRTPEAVDALTNGNEFTATLSKEALPAIDGDLIVWIDSGDDFQRLEDLAARPFLEAAREDREVFLDAALTGAFSHASLVSPPDAIDRLEPMIEAALDADPEAPSAARAERP